MSSIDKTTLLLASLDLAGLFDDVEETSKRVKAEREARWQRYRDKLYKGNTDSEVFTEERCVPILHLVGAMGELDHITQTEVLNQCPKSSEDKLRQIIYLDAVSKLSQAVVNLVQTVTISDEEVKKLCDEAGCDVDEAVLRAMANQLKKTMKS